MAANSETIQRLWETHKDSKNFVSGTHKVIAAYRNLTQICLSGRSSWAHLENICQLDDEEDIEIQYEEESDTLPEVDDTECAGCRESYNNTRKKEDWLQCIICQKWFHENCSHYINTC
ncbi:hypothetical protein PV327_008163 [Microctonus hyperodae]|uniref:Uncharacterized protein n=1 Tax=Microctonus hyperodae TaxID=165561 RepID=A0AA39F2I7_MICHY|nr:hypothetical protein PV327_008163 [Microctonus hyperodae]